MATLKSVATSMAGAFDKWGLWKGGGEDSKSYVGMVIYSSTLDTLEKVQAFYGGKKWVKIESRVIIGQGAEYDINSVGGEKEHTLNINEIPSHTHTQKPHTHSQNAHNHTQNFHTHIQNEHTHSTTPHTHNLACEWGTNSNLNCPAGTSGTYMQIAGTGALSRVQVGFNITSTGVGINNTTPINQSTAATNNSATAVNNNTTAINNNSGGGVAHNNLPPYRALYIWERTE